MITVEILIYGKVQKVGFRAYIRKIATDLNITGTVINLPNGKVRIYASGEAILIEKFTSMIYSCPRAVIRDLETTEIPVREFSGFSILKTDNNINTEF